MLSVFQLDAQNRKALMHDRIEAQKIAFLTEKLELTPDESKTFWPLYNEYNTKKKEVKDKWTFNQAGIRSMEEAEAEDLIQKYIQREQDLLDLQSSYFTKFKESISAKKIIRIIPAEEAFKREILKRLRNRK